MKFEQAWGRGGGAHLDVLEAGEVQDVQRWQQAANTALEGGVVGADAAHPRVCWCRQHVLQQVHKAPGALNLDRRGPHQEYESEARDSN